MNNFWRGADEWLLLPKLLYLTFSLSYYSTYTYTAKFFADNWGIPVYSYGYLSGISAICFAGSVVWSTLADRTGRHKTLLIGTSAVYAALYCLLRAEWGLVRESKVGKHVYVALMYGGSSFFASAMQPILDDAVLRWLERDSRWTKDLFGRQRLWSAIGHALITIINGVLRERFGYDGMFAMVALTTALFIFTVAVGLSAKVFLERGALECEEASEELLRTKAVTTQRSYLPIPKNPAIVLLTSARFVFFLFMIFVVGYVRNVVGSFLPYYLEAVLHLPPVLYAFALQSRLVPEFLIFQYNKELTNMIGIEGMLLAAQLSGVLRATAYTLLPAVPGQTALLWIVAAIELLKGVNNATVMSAGVRYANDVAPYGCSATAQGYFAGCYGSLSMAAGGLLGGFVMQIIEQMGWGGAFELQGLFGLTTAVGVTGLVLWSVKSMFFTQ